MTTLEQHLAKRPDKWRSLRDRFPGAFEKPVPDWLPGLDDEIDQEPIWPYLGKTCPGEPHRGPEGPNEDIGQCSKCGGLSFSMRPEGETFGRHWPDCSLPNRHEGECVGGGTGHPDAPKIRG